MVYFLNKNEKALYQEYFPGNVKHCSTQFIFRSHCGQEVLKENFSIKSNFLDILLKPGIDGMPTSLKFSWSNNEICFSKETVDDLHCFLLTKAIN